MKEMKELISVPEDWSNLFTAINHLRVMNKFHPAVLFENLDFFANFCKQSCENLRSNISKNGLMLSNEMFKNKETMQTEKYQESITKFLQVVLPAVFARTVYDKVFIAKEAKNAVAQCMTNFVSPDILTIIISEGCKNRINNKTLTEISYTNFMKKLVSSADFNNKNHLFLADGGENSVTFINQLYDGYVSAPRTKKGCTEVLKDLNGKI